MNDGLVCWRCGTSIDDWPLPLSRTAECKRCRADLHVCRLCEFYDPRMGKQCREPVADEVQNKERANFCGYFTAKAGAFNSGNHVAQQAARTQLDALFGSGPAQAREPAAASSAPSEADLARTQLEKLFGGDKQD